MPRAGWLRGPGFDLTFVAGISLLAALAGGLVVANPRLFYAFFLLNAWLLAITT
jgi:hypothetical protein